VQSRRMYRELARPSRSTRLSHPLRFAVLLLAFVGFSSLTSAMAQAPDPAVQTTPPSDPSAAQPPVPTVSNNGNTSTSQKAKRAAARLFAKGAKAEAKKDPRTTMDLFDHAVALDPQNADYRSAALLVREQLVSLLIHSAEDARRAGNNQMVRQRLEEALEIDPKNPVATQHYSELIRLQSKVPDQFPARRAQHIGREILFLPKPGLHDFHLRMTRRDLIKQVYGDYGIHAQCDDNVPPKADWFDIDNADFETAAKALRLVTHTFAVPLDPVHALFATDTRDSIERYERMETETFYLSGLTTAEMTDVASMVKSVYGLDKAAVLPDKNTLTVRARESLMDSLRYTLNELMQGHDQVELQIRLIEVSRTNARETGLTMPQSFGAFNVYTEAQNALKANQSVVQQIIAAGLAAPGDYVTIAALLLAGGYLSGSPLGQPFATFGGGIVESGITFGSIAGHIALNSSDARTLDQIQLRLADQEAGTIRSGTRYPITSSQFSSGTSNNVPNIPGLNTSGYSSLLNSLGLNPNGLSTAATIPQVQYEDLGLTLKATPHVLGDDEVELKFDLQIEALGASSANGIPVLNNRHFTAVTTLKTGESSMLISNLTKQETKSVGGESGIGDIPGLSSLTNDTAKEVDESTLAVVITPTLVRRAHRSQVGNMMLLPKQDDQGGGQGSNNSAYPQQTDNPSPSSFTSSPDTQNVAPTPPEVQNNPAPMVTPPMQDNH